MATGDYCTLAELQYRIWPPGATADTADDAALENIITAVSRTVDNFCNRRFYTTDTTETRYFSTYDNEFLYPDVDIVSITTLKVDYDGDRTYEITFDTTDYDLMPANAAVDSKPYSWVQISPLGTERWPTHRNGIEIVGYFGWSATPAAVKEATLIQSMRVWKRKDSPFGIISNPVGGELRLLNKLDPDVEVLLAPYKKWV